MTLSKDRILGVDPGTNILGFAIVEIKNNKAHVLDINVIKLKEYNDQQTKLKEIFLRLQEIIETYHTSVLSIESPFYGKNPQSMLKLGRAQGVAIAAAMVMGVDIYEYSPKKIKQSVTGNGNASKEQVANMLSKSLNYNIDNKYLDATDALAAAMCYYYQSSSPLGINAKSKSWESYIAKNPHKIV